MACAATIVMKTVVMNNRVVREAPRAVPDGPGRAGNRDRRPGDGLDVGADFERIAHVLAGELRRELRRIDREVAVRLTMRRDDDAGEDAARVDAHQNLNRAIVGTLERFEIGRPERVADCGLLSRGGGGTRGVGNIVWWIAFLGRK
jgi:hypothetical protein